jgi:hypothetical protein
MSNQLKINTMKKVNVKCFWKGSVMFDRTMGINEYAAFLKQLSKDFFKGCEDTIPSSIEFLNQTEAEYFSKYQSTGKYELDGRESAISLLIINSLIKRGIAKNDDMTGLLMCSTK